MPAPKKVLLVSTGHPFFKGALWGAYDVEFPLNVASIAAFLEKNGVPVDVVDMQVIVEPLERLKGMDFGEYCLVGLSSNLGNAYNAYKVASLIKSKSPDVPVFGFGGFAILKDIMLRECGEIDFVVYGEDEHTALELARCVSGGGGLSAVKGLIHRAGGGISVNPPREFEKNPDVFPFLARHKFDMNKYRTTPGKYLVMPQHLMLSSRGCNRGCFFCPQLGGRGIRYRSPANIVAEIDELQGKYGAKEIYFLDDTFTADRDRVLEFADRMKKRGRGIYLRAASRIDTVDDEVLSRLKAVGLYSIGYGIESGDDGVLKFNRKGITVAQVRDAVAMTKKAGIETRGFFMLNLPGDTVETTERTVGFIRELDLDLINIQITYPWPNTEMRAFIKANYAIDEALWDNWECSDGDDVLFTQSDLTAEYLKATYKRVIRGQYINPRFIYNWAKRLRTFDDWKYSFLQFASLFKRTVLRRHS